MTIECITEKNRKGQRENTMGEIIRTEKRQRDSGRKE